MGWSLSSVSFRMSGSGSWQNLLPDESSGRFYAEIYPLGTSLPTIPGHLRKLLPAWIQAAIVRLENEKVVPLGPIMNDDDLKVFNPWFQDISGFMCQAVLERMDDYRALASNLGRDHPLQKREMDNLLTILICALTLDSRVFSGLREEVIGSYPPRGVAGNFFFWGYAFATGPQRIFGFTTYNGLDGKQLHMIRSHGLDRQGIKELLRRRSTWDYLDDLISDQERVGRTEPQGKEQNHALKKTARSLQEVGLLTQDQPPFLAIPVFDNSDGKTIAELCVNTSRKIMDYFMAQLNDLENLTSRCSFARCSRPDVICMLFHLAYSYTTDRLAEKGVISDFPKSAGGEWGVWIS
jgi:hypothetical protein